MIGIVDYGAGNLGSVANALQALGQPHRCCTNAAELESVTRVVLPGVGHFGAAARALLDSGLFAALQDWARRGQPLFGICLGMQLLFASSEEAPGAPGLGLLPGRCERLRSRRVPHLGWNQLQWRGTAPAGDEAPFVYFAHSFHVVGAEPGDIEAVASLEATEVLAACRRGGIGGCQFHPEKSGPTGLRLLQQWLSC
ncbi:MAG: imidazole glycerol phosphate synthase subunit HisH [Planctomycetes bacterium]|nr:imidazole glycerol phosphate synthase subunit HisH [Planctomycetota bacterium]